VIGYENGWKESKFDITIENLSEVTLNAQWLIPRGLNLSSDHIILVKPLQTAVVTVTLSPTKV